MKTCMNIVRDLTGIKYCMFKHANVQTIKSINIRNCLSEIVNNGRSVVNS